MLDRLHSLHTPDLFYTFCVLRPRWWFPLVLLGTPPVYSLISDIPGLQHSFSDITHWGAAQWVVVVTGLGALVALTAYHIALARARMARAELAAYILSRCVVYTCVLVLQMLFIVVQSTTVAKRVNPAEKHFLWWCMMMTTCHSNARLFACTTAMAVTEDHYKLHLHHLYLGWAFGLFAEFNTPLSAATLAVTTGIFVQGIGAYSFAANLYNPNCFQLPLMAGQTMTCQLAAASSNVSIEVCPMRPAVHVDAHCTVPAGR